MTYMASNIFSEFWGRRRTFFQTGVRVDALLDYFIKFVVHGRAFDSRETSRHLINL